MLLGVDGVPLVVAFNGRRWKRKGDAGASGTGPERLTAPMPGKVVRVLARTGDRVAARQPVVVIEAMKMENELRASKDGAITDVLVREGQSVEAGTLLAIITPP
jgi:biotin carboxyl carrier protein